MPVYIHTIQTSVPEHAYRQEDLRDRMKNFVGKTEARKRVIQRLYDRSGIQVRHSILADFRDNTSQELFFNGHGASPGTGFRNKMYEEKGRRLFVGTARKVLDNSSVSPAGITHLITVSCTGFYAPGPDYDIIHALGLPKSIERYHLGFMGCYAGIPAMKLASQICRVNPKARVMIVSVELCSIHFQAGQNTDELISSAIFADGAAGTLVSGHKPESDTWLEIGRFASTITDEGEKDMAWTIGDTGFNMVLSTYVPEILSRNLDRFMDPVMNQYGIDRSQVQLWAVHPGGRAILDRVENQLNLPADTLKHSRDVLANYGNMSSATIFFVLKNILDTATGTGKQNIFTMAFGPGLTIESTLMTLNKNHHP